MIVTESIEKDEDIDNIQVEINSLKFSQNQTFSSCITGCVKALLETSPAKPSAHIRKWLGILQSYIRTDPEKLQTIKEIETHIVELPCQNSFHIIIKELFDADVVNEEAILEWNSQCENQNLKGLMAQFIEWLEAEDEDSEEESEED